MQSKEIDDPDLEFLSYQLIRTAQDDEGKEDAPELVSSLY